MLINFFPKLHFFAGNNVICNNEIAIYSKIPHNPTTAYLQNKVIFTV